MDRLDFKIRSRLEQPIGARVNSSIDGYRKPFSYFDFIINGVSLADTFNVDQKDLVGMLSFDSLKQEPLSGSNIFNYFKRFGSIYYVLSLQLPCELEFRRVQIYGCPECGDLGCGNVTMQLIETKDMVIWQRFDNGNEEFANYMSLDKYYSDGSLYELWQERNRDYSILDAFGKSSREEDYEFIYDLKAGKVPHILDDDIHRGDYVTVDFPEVGPFEFDKGEYLKALQKLKP